MEPFQILRSFEQCYHAIQPAQVNSADAFACYSGLHHPLFNLIMHFSGDGKRLDELLALAPADCPLSVWVHPLNRAKGLTHLLNERGFVHVLNCSLMSWKIRPIEEHSPYEIRPAEMGTFNDILANVAQFDERVKGEFAQLLQSIAAENYLVYREGKAVGTGTLFPVGSTAGFFNISTLSEHQRNGCGRSMIRYRMRRASELGLERVALLSSPHAKGLFLREGFEEALPIELYARFRSM